MCAPEEAASWEWELDAFAPPGLDSALATAVRMSEVLREHGLLRPDSLRWRWFAKGRGSVGTTELAVPESPTEGELSRGIAGSRPVAHPNAEVGALRMSGTGSWFDAEGAERRERDLVVLTVYPEERHLAAEVAVFHDIWGYCDFRGEPHPKVQARNAPRLASALRALERLLGTAPEPGEATYFGRADGYGPAMPDLIDGKGPDLTDRL
ncbi:hypothetical protein ACH4KC_21370 [Streptomyces griseoaurantiacus]|jgi:hypothetical protein|uniref:Uncharacterized protein n=1 Tax=Streptomyces griseoaurantiacus TaxID=68213 RepID=A0A7W2DZQ6_9ACTN|nr:MULTISPECIES: hypothetical protein [Streptomyces]MBA5226009.1 hypothetical protein [Streptomyces griseoaurantiacus]MDX3087617.1 hypothetical protein [Streptomyces sp. ME12-02E]MDX3330972.1 hypothetical protein [Streptomyces sp. ME02-6978a]MDX3359648.1 hypothetical protein [Streptomyces sp. ME02-6978.2a]WTI30933.1 hypothetical protein OHA67_15420 [Streptomyces jietaisiensis]